MMSLIRFAINDNYYLLLERPPVFIQLLQSAEWRLFRSIRNRIGNNMNHYSSFAVERFLTNIYLSQRIEKGPFDWKISSFCFKWEHKSRWRGSDNINSLSTTIEEHVYFSNQLNLLLLIIWNYYDYSSFTLVYCIWMNEMINIITVLLARARWYHIININYRRGVVLPPAPIYIWNNVYVHNI